MPEFSPDVDALLKRFKIDKPNEQFQIGPITPDPDSSPSPQGKTAFGVPVKPQSDRLQEEAGRVQEIIQILKDTALPIAVPVPPEDQPFLGSTITTSDYIKSFEGTDPLSQRKQQHYEQGVLSESGHTPHWPTLMLPELISVRDSLLSARDTIEGKMLTGSLLGVVSSGGLGSWQSSLLNSDLSRLNDQIMLGSARVRFKVAQTVFTLNASLKGSHIERLLGEVLTPEVERIKPSIRTLLGYLTKVRALFTHSQLLLGFEHIKTRDALLTIAENVVIEKMLNILVVKLSEVMNGLVRPVLDALEKGIGSGPISQILTEDVDHQLISIIGGTCQAIVGEYKHQVAGFVRDHEKQNGLQLNKLQSLGERSIVGRWIVHLDQVINELEKVLTTPSLSRALAAKAVHAAIKIPAAPDLPVLQRFRDHPELGQAELIALRTRTFETIPQNADPAVVPLTGDQSVFTETDAQFGSGDVSPFPKFDV